MKRFKSEQGSTTVEFALLFPIAFIVTFFCTVILFRSTDALLLNYQSNRIARIHNLCGSVSADVSYDAVNIPLLNQFQNRSTQSDDSGYPFIESHITVSRGLIPDYLLTLSMSDEAVALSGHYRGIIEGAIYINDY